MAVGEGGRDNGVKELISTTTALGNKRIDLSRKSLTEIPAEVLDLTQLEFLYLEGNNITEIPPVLFERLSSLKWLDLRNNHISEVPSAIGSHKALRNLLLEGNELKELPSELGFAKLSGLNIASNPLEMPPSSVIERGTQEVLKFLRENYASKMQMTENQAALSVRPTSSSSSSEEDPLAYNHESQIAVRPLEVPNYEDEVKVEKVRLPPIFQAAAERPRHRTVDESYEILRGQKSTQFKPKSKTNVQISEPERRTSPRRYDEGRRLHSPPKKSSISLDEGSYKRINYFARTKRNNDSTARGSYEIQVLVEERMEQNGDKMKKKRKSRSHSPTKVANQPSKKHEKNSSPNHENDSNSNERMEGELKEITARIEKITVDDASNEPQAGNIQKLLQRNTAHCNEMRDLTTVQPKPIGLNLKEGDFVAIKVPSKLYIKGQPCLGKITSTEDGLGLLTVHYFSGSYGGYWRPMMSRTSPYLRKVPHQNVLCKFKLSDDGRMSPITRATVRKIVDGDGL